MEEEEEGENLWALYFDVDDDGLKKNNRIGNHDKRMLAVDVWRRELRVDRVDAVQERIDRLQARAEHDRDSESTAPS